MSSRAEIGTKAVRVHTPDHSSSCLSPQARTWHCAPYVQFSDLIPTHPPPLSGVGIIDPIFFALSSVLVSGGAERTGPKRAFFTIAPICKTGIHFPTIIERNTQRKSNLKKTFQNSMECYTPG